MASSNSLLSEEQFLCPICLDVFTRPVSTPCGHNFCMSCITSYWDDIPVSQCPVCKETFERRPDLKVNTFISELASQFMTLQVDAHIWSTDQHQARCGAAVLCDFCTDTQREAVNSCLECLTSYCDVHLEPHHRAAGLKTHTLVEPLASLEDRICKEHTRLLTLFCRKDKVLLCDVCASLCHVNHDVVPVQRAYEEKKALLGDTEASVQQMIQERLQKVRAMKESVKQSNTETKDVIANSVQDLTALISEIQKSQTELVKVIEEKQKAAEEQADGFISSMEREITELQRTTMKLRELKQTEDQLCFLQSFPNSSILPHTMDLSTFSFNRQVEIHHIRKTLNKSMSQLRMLLNKMTTEIQQFSDGTDVSNDATLRYVQQYEVDIVLDPDTAHRRLILSNDRKQVRYSSDSGLRRNLNPNMFTTHLAVLGQRGFSSRRFYFEVFVGGKTEWNLGVAKASIQRRGALVRSPHCGLWAIMFQKDKFVTFCSPEVPVALGKVERVGVFVDYDGGQVSFYDVQTATLIYSFTECVFTEELHPYFNPCDNEFGSNLGPMIIVPVSRTV
ncbi:E3 ubiquitin-protein ligase TRIM39-like isoform X2 [Sander lucioperca]|uniref:E3 ubiquitin-protein ligase TRIM39-like n=1 Tax=Sander lucioperca TaxID=283035 RepID=A0A8C9XEI7_SANLU|nr:E3 ubiquitin-protein ligase TRIM39-like isoform X2 [Sander lucioperca]XP_031170894.1 E3 ubiquitin-protein ligase TRIM39-like isoform X2 [Sander lucioperca]XP_031170896.1 E3 ubiquitin-protein ligase TRIM39-like isoform X2 [Sander lucioperca]XP_035853237.1 E3 ubiquitin-protein ligase TRIM39-like isoform X2 [Sander lucioperca]